MRPSSPPPSPHAEAEPLPPRPGFKASTRSEIPYWPALLQLFAACFIPVFFCLAFFLNLATWSKARIKCVLLPHRPPRLSAPSLDTS